VPGRPRRAPRPFSFVLVALSLLVAACGRGPSAGPDAPAQRITEEGLRAHVRFLADDALEGRAPGTRGGELAALYIATQMEAAGLEPVQGSYFQTVPVIGHTPDPASARLELRYGGRSAAAEYLEDFVVWSGRAAPEASALGELVFVGYGVEAPEAGWSDYGDVDMAGKVALILVNDPPPTNEEPNRFDGEAMTYYGRWTYKFEEAARQGAAGAIIVHETGPAGYPWGVVRSSWSGEQFALSTGDQDPPPVPVAGWISRETAMWVLAMAGHSLEELEAAAESREFAPVPTGIQADARVASEVRTLETPNVVGLLPGRTRPDELVILTAHYDHLGIGPAVDGDSIYNGAYDNASGVAVLLEVARAFRAVEPAPARSVLFMATAAEESGLLGAQWYADAPLFPLYNTVATLNVDGASLWGRTEDMIVMGGDRNELGAFAEARARQMGIRLVPDPEPEKGLFFRSDHFPFARAGVPALWIRHGERFRGRPEGWGREMLDRYTAEAYHSPLDRFSEDFVFDGAVQQGRLLFLTSLDIATDNSFPNWFEGSEFRAARDRSLAARREGRP
jgi:Zn-dependent M28 family amino/carboxypeptidase